MIHVLRTRAELRNALAAAQRPIGLIPTMGWLHEGHRSLMRRARADDTTTVVTIFVNPRQFGDPGDLARYPRSEARDLAICEEEGVDLVWAPSVEEVYPAGFDTTVSVGAIAHPLEGAARPGHFDGVATVVAILFALVGAEHAYFGQKDAQQVMVIRQMARDLACPRLSSPAPRSASPMGSPSRRATSTSPPSNGPRPRCSTVPCWRRAPRTIGGSARRTSCGRSCGASWRPSRSRTSTTSRWPTARR